MLPRTDAHANVHGNNITRKASLSHIPIKMLKSPLVYDDVAEVPCARQNSVAVGDFGENAIQTCKAFAFRKLRVHRNYRRLSCRTCRAPASRFYWCVNTKLPIHMPRSITHHYTLRDIWKPGLWTIECTVGIIRASFPALVPFSRRGLRI